MKKALLVACLMAALCDLADAQQRTYTIQLSAEQVGVVQRGLLELQGKDMLPTWNAIVSQFNAQNAPPPPSPPPAQNAPPPPPPAEKKE